MDINLEYYKIFYYTGKLQSISKAAEELCISQPAVSQSIKQLEKQLGVSLFLRKSKGVALTVEGEVLYSYIKQGYETILLGENKLRQMVDMESGEVRIGASDMTLKYFLLNHLEKFHEIYPNIKVSVTNAPTPETLTLLAEGKIDFGIVSGPVEEAESISLKEVRQIQDVFIAGSSFLSLKNKKLQLNELEKLPIVCLEPNTSTRKYIDSFLKSNEVKITPEFEIATSDMIVQFVLKNFGIGCVVRDFAGDFIDSGKVFELTFDKELPKRSICVATNVKIPMSSAGKHLYEMMI